MTLSEDEILQVDNKEVHILDINALQEIAGITE